MDKGGKPKRSDGEHGMTAKREMKQAGSEVGARQAGEAEASLPAMPAEAEPEGPSGIAESEEWPGTEEVGGPAGTGEMEAARAEAAGYLDDLRRLKAEFENYRKSVMREQTAMAESAAGRLVEGLLPVLDSFDLALAAAEQSQDFERMRRGLELVYGQFHEVLHKEGLTAIEGEGSLFDPALQEAVVQVEDAAHGEPTVVAVLRKGYAFKGKVLRPAMVKVAKA